MFLKYINDLIIELKRLIKDMKDSLNLCFFSGDKFET